MGRTRWFVLAMVAGLALAAAACTPQTDVTVTQGEPSGISVTGSGTVAVVPDIAELSLGVEVTRPTVGEAREEAAQAMEAVRASIEDNGVEERDIQTQVFNIRPEMRFPQDGQPEITGFVVTNIVRAKVRELDTVSQVLDEAVAAGGDFVRVNNIAFTVDEPEQYLDEARQEAVADAREKAQRLADLGGVELGAVRTISESSNGAVPPPFAGRGAAQEDTATPISPGETQIRLTVTVVYDIED